MSARAGCVPLTDAQRAEAEKYLELCDRAAGKFARKCRGAIPRDEFLSAAFEGLADAVKGFDEAKGVPFDYYATRRAEGACLDMMRRVRGGVVHVPRTETGGALGVVSIDALDPVTGRPWAEAVPCPEGSTPGLGAEESAVLARHLARLGGEERLILFRRFGLEGRRPASMAEMVRRFGHHPYEIDRIIRLALSRLRAMYEEVPPPPGPARTPRSRMRVGRPIDRAEARRDLLVAVGYDPDAASFQPTGAVDRLLAGLSPPRRLVVELAFGLDGTARPLREVARHLGRAFSVVHKSHGAALEAMRGMCEVNATRATTKETR